MKDGRMPLRILDDEEEEEEEWRKERNRGRSVIFIEVQTR